MSSTFICGCWTDGTLGVNGWYGHWNNSRHRNSICNMWFVRYRFSKSPMINRGTKCQFFMGRMRWVWGELDNNRIIFGKISNDMSFKNNRDQMFSVTLNPVSLSCEWKLILAYKKRTFVERSHLSTQELNRYKSTFTTKRNFNEWSI